MTATPEGLAIILAPDQHWKVAYARVAGLVRRFLDNLPPGETRGTTGLAHALWPAEQVQGVAQAAARKRLLRALQVLAEHDLKDYAMRGAPVHRPKVGTIRPWVWHRKYEGKPAAPAPAVCPHCGGALS